MKFSVFEWKELWHIICFSSLICTEPTVFIYPWLKSCSDVESMALLCSLIYHLIIPVVMRFFILPELIFFDCKCFYLTWSQWAQEIFALFLNMGRKTHLLSDWNTISMPFLLFSFSFTPSLSLSREKMSLSSLAMYITKFPNPKLFPLKSPASHFFFVSSGLDSGQHPTKASQVPSIANECVMCTGYIKIVQEFFTIWTTDASLIISHFVFVCLTVSSQI